MFQACTEYKLYTVIVLNVILVNIGKYPVRDLFAVVLPGLSIFEAALPLVPRLSVNQQDGEVRDVEVRQEM